MWITLRSLGIGGYFIEVQWALPVGLHLTETVNIGEILSPISTLPDKNPAIAFYRTVLIPSVPDCVKKCFSVMVSYWQFTTTHVYKLFFNFHNMLQTDYI